MSEQDLLNLASQKLLALSEAAPAIRAVANAEGENPVIAANTWVEIKARISRRWGSIECGAARISSTETCRPRSTESA